MKLRQRWQHATKSIYFEFVFLPTLVAFVVGISVSKLPQPSGKNPSPLAKLYQATYQQLNLQDALQQALIAWVVTQLILLRLIYGKDYDALKFFKMILSELPEPLARYGKDRISYAIGIIDNEVRLLQNLGLSGQSLKRKVDIIESLVEHLGPDLTRFWATTLDLPTKFFDESDRFFDLQRDKLKRVQNKRRIVVLKSSQLSAEIQDRHEQLEKFISWHRDNSFDLLFLVDDANKFTIEAKQYLEDASMALRPDDLPVTDFAILGDQWVYGEVAAEIGSTDNHSRSLRLFDGTRRKSIVHNYIHFYEALWDNWRIGQWPVLSPAQVISECTRQKLKSASPHIPALSGQPFYDDMIQKISTARESIVAVDIAPLKPGKGVSEWVNNPDYTKWLEACLAAKKGGAQVTRLHVFFQAESDGAVRKQISEQVLDVQINAGCEVFIASVKELWSEDLPIHDFILVDDKISFSLGWNEEFSAASLSAQKNLDPPSVVNWHKAVFERLRASKNVKHANDMRVEDRAKFLETLA